MEVVPTFTFMGSPAARMCVANERVAGKRSGIVWPEFVPFADAMKEAAGCESWSRFCLENLDLLLSRAAANPADGARRPGPVRDPA